MIYMAEGFLYNIDEKLVEKFEKKYPELDCLLCKDYESVSEIYSLEELEEIFGDYIEDALKYREEMKNVK